MIVCCKHKRDNRVQNADSQDSMLHWFRIASLDLQLLVCEIGVAHLQQELDRGRVKSFQHGGSDAVENAPKLFGE